MRRWREVCTCGRRSFSYVPAGVITAAACRGVKERNLPNYAKIWRDPALSADAILTSLETGTIRYNVCLSNFAEH
jgi:hypothetical protein